MRQVSASILDDLGLENRQSHGNSGVERSAMMVCYLDETSESQGYGDGLKSAILRGYCEVALERQDNGDEDEGADDLLEEGLPVLGEAILSHFKLAQVVRVLWRQYGDPVARDLPLTVDLRG